MNIYHPGRIFRYMYAWHDYTVGQRGLFDAHVNINAWVVRQACTSHISILLTDQHNSLLYAVMKR